MNCDEALAAMSAALDGEASDAERSELAGHLAGCGPCRALARDFEEMSGALGEQAVPPAALSGRVSAALEEEKLRKKTPAPWRRYGALAAVLAVALCLGTALRFADTGMDSLSGSADAMAEDWDVNQASGGSGEEQDVVGRCDFTVTRSSEPPAAAASEGDENQAAAEEAVLPLQPPEEPDAYAAEPPEEGAVLEALKLVLEELGGTEAYPGAELSDYGGYPACFLSREAWEDQTCEWWLEFTGLSGNGKYLTFRLVQYTVADAGSPAGGESYAVCFNNYAVAAEGGEVLFEKDENQTVEHILAYRAAISE